MTPDPPGTVVPARVRRAGKPVEIDALRSPTFTSPRVGCPHPGLPSRGASRVEPRSHEAPASPLPSSKDHVAAVRRRRVHTAELVVLAELADVDGCRFGRPLLRCLSLVAPRRALTAIALSRRASRVAKVVADRGKLLSGERLRSELLGSTRIPPVADGSRPPSSGAPPPMPRRWCEQDGSTSSTSCRAAGSARGEPRAGIARGIPCGPGTDGRASREGDHRPHQDLASPSVPRRTSGSVSARGASPRSVGARVAPITSAARAGHPASRSNAGLTAGTFGSLTRRSPTRRRDAREVRWCRVPRLMVADPRGAPPPRRRAGLACTPTVPRWAWRAENECGA